MPATARRVIIVLPVLIALQAISTDLYLPALPSIVADLDTSIAHVQLTLSLFLVTFGVAQLAYGPLSDRFGRRPLLLGGTLLYALGSIACMLAPTIEVLILCRVIQALGACSGAVLGRAVIRDVFEGAAGAKVLAYLATAMSLAPMVGPVLGGWLTVAVGWRATFAALSLFGLVALLGVILVLPETNRRPDARAMQPGVLLANYAGLLRDRPYLARCGIAACGYGGIFAFISGSAYLLIDVVGLAPNVYGLCFAVAILGWAAGAFAGGKLGHRLGLQTLLAVGTATCMGAGLIGLVLALTSPPSVPQIVLPMMLFLVGAGFTLPAAMALAVAPYPEKAGVASAGLGCLQLGTAALIGVALSLAYDGTAVPMMTTLALTGTGAVLARFMQQEGPPLRHHEVIVVTQRALRERPGPG